LKLAVNRARQRVIKFELKANRIQKTVLDSLTYAAGKLWNIANYERRNWTNDGDKNIPTGLIKRRD
jgi:hypothetical protein